MLWMASVLERVEQAIPRFGDSVRIITGASGGMLEGSYYVLHRRNVATGVPEVDTGTGRFGSWVEAIPLDGITHLASYMAFCEPWNALYPSRLREDRGIVLERLWGKNPRFPWATLRFPLKPLLPLERAGKIPSLIFSPMMIEDGRRLLISNLDLGRTFDGRLSSLVSLRGTEIRGTVSPGENRPVTPTFAELSALELYRVLPEAEGLYLSTAVRMSATTFPFVSPAVSLPTLPPRHVVDAGYFDNFGIQVATSWISQNRHWLATNTSGVLLLQIRDTTHAAEQFDLEVTSGSSWGGFSFLFSPLSGLMAARAAPSLVR